MERLTFEGNFCDIARCRELPCKYDGNCTQRQVWERLKAYEDAGLSPQACAEARDIEETLSGCDYSISRMVELMEADKDGRVLILPHEDYTWSIRGDIAIGIVEANCRKAAEAEKALQEMEGKNDGNETSM